MYLIDIYGTFHVLIIAEYIFSRTEYVRQQNESQKEIISSTLPDHNGIPMSAFQHYQAILQSSANTIWVCYQLNSILTPTTRR